MGYYRVCEICGANLDPGERCSDCYPVQEEKEQAENDIYNYRKGQKEHGLTQWIS